MLTLKRMLKLMRGNKWFFLIAIVSTAFTAVFRLVRPVIVQTTIDTALQGGALPDNQIVIWIVDKIGGASVLQSSLWICGIALIISTMFNSLFMVIRGFFSAKASENISKNLKDSLYDHLQKLPYDYHVKAKTGDLIQRCTSDVSTIQRFLSNQVLEMARCIFLVVFSVSIMLTISVKMTLVSVCMIPLVFIFSYVFFKKVRVAFKRTDEKEGELSATLQENLTGVRVVRAFGRQKHEIEKYEQKNGEFRDYNFAHLRLMSYYWSLSDFISHAQQLAVLVTGIFLTYNGEISLGTYILFVSYISMLVYPIRQLGRILSDFGRAQVALTRVFEILDTPIESDTPGASQHPLKGQIVFDKVNFGYDTNKLILKDMSFKIAPGETIAILGSTGSGKSTLMHILLRLYDYKSGSIKINGKELRDVEKKWLREKVGIVLQEPFLYSKTIGENLKMARHDATEEDIINATKTAAAHGFITETEKGYDTMVGERGVTLSGGQKQRLAIARTLIKNSDILIFDDSLSAVDTETDAQIRAALNERSKDVTTFIISQRITTLMHADKIFVIEDGRLADCGTHDELIGRAGLYLRIWDIQSMFEDEFELDDDNGGSHERVVTV